MHGRPGVWHPRVAALGSQTTASCLTREGYTTSGSAHLATSPRVHQPLSTDTPHFHVLQGARGARGFTAGRPGIRHRAKPGSRGPCLPPTRFTSNKPTPPHATPRPKARNGAGVTPRHRAGDRRPGPGALGRPLTRRNRTECGRPSSGRRRRPGR